jgi:hypothetical protein
LGGECRPAVEISFRVRIGPGAFEGRPFRLRAVALEDDRLRLGDIGSVASTILANFG